MRRSSYLPVAAVLSLLSPALLAQTPPPPGAAAAPPSGQNSAAKLTASSSIEEIAATPVGTQLLEKHFPGILTHESYNDFKSMTLADVLPYSDGRITEEKIAAFDADLKAAQH